MPYFTAIPGMKDYFGAEGRLLFFLEEQFARIAEQFGYQPLRTPLVEQAELFYKGVAEGEYVVQKEMYEFSDRGGRTLALRPESTPSVVRALIEHHFFGNSTRKIRVYYFGPMFRYDRPQKARYRLFHQVGVEAIGWKDPELDVEIIHLFLEYLRILGIHSCSLILNTLGCTTDLSRYRQELTQFLQKHRREFSEKEQQKIDRNPLRLLDSKDPDTQAVLEHHSDLPRIFSFLCAECQRHFQEVCQGLETLGWKYQVNPFLVRGLDYYTRTVFEVISDELGAQDSIGGGGRYDNLFSLYTGGKMDVPCVGFAAGVERLLALSPLQQKMHNWEKQPLFTLLFIALDSDSRKLLYPFRFQIIRNGIAADIVWDKSLKSALSYADRMGIPFCLIMGENERLAGKILLRDMRTGTQEEIPFDLSEVMKRVQ